ncbi:uncharacterized protein V1510DRAFT_183130 [Dipodascopsis tothii]|uniref:uncharacterized protein n=1 Tax=Dipodascopsis tothii TaxID=44089 RepID=UPI0034CF6302
MSAETATPAVTEAPAETTGSSAFLGHLKSYPVVSSTLSYTSSIGLVKKASTTAKPYVSKATTFVKPAITKASPVLSKVDQFGDNTLGKVDKFVPALKTSPEEISNVAKKSVDSVKDTATVYKNAAKTKVNDTLIAPTKSAVDKAKARSVSLYDAKGRPFVKARFDPLLAPVNVKLIAALDNYLPAAEAKDTTPEEAEAAPAATEFGKLYNIGSDAISRVKPLVAQRVEATKTKGRDTFAHVFAVPISAKTHLIAVWEENKAGVDPKEQSALSLFFVSFNTGKQIANEAFEYTETYVNDKTLKIRSLAKNLIPTKGEKAALTNGQTAAVEEAPAAETAAPETA